MNNAYLPSNSLSVPRVIVEDIFILILANDLVHFNERHVSREGDLFRRRVFPLPGFWPRRELYETGRPLSALWDR